MPSTFRIPDAADPFGTFDAAGAWLALPAVTRDLIGALALQATFGAFVGQDAADKPHHFTEDQRAEGIDREGFAVAAMQETIERSLPAIFGREGESPAWAQGPRASAGRPPIARHGPVADAIAMAGGQRGLAAAIGVTQGTVSRMLSGQRCSARHAIGIERATGGRVSRADLRPDLFADDRTDREMADRAVRGLRGVLAPASALTEADHVRG